MTEGASEKEGGSEDITRLLREALEGRPGAADECFRQLYQQLRAIAAQRMAGERKDHTLQATALVHEAYLRLIGGRSLSWNDRAHFYNAAAEAMRHLLVEHARSKGRAKRGGGRQRVLGDVLDLVEAEPREILALDDAMRRLAEWDKQAAAVVRLRFYAGLSVEETAAALQVSERTVDRLWVFARAWLFRAMEREIKP